MARSPDLTSPDFYLWGYLKNKVYFPAPDNLASLKYNIENEIKKIKEETLIKVSNNMLKRAKLCLEADGNHFQHLL
jgi:hypothetical protein